MSDQNRDQNKERIGSRLRETRERRGFRRAEVARGLEVAESTLQRWENGDAEVGVLAAIGLAKLYRVTLVDLLGEVAMPEHPPHEIGPSDLAELLRLVAAQENLHKLFRRRASPALRRALEERKPHDRAGEQ